MLKKTLSLSFAFLLSSLLSGCAIAPPDVPICTELDINRGWCTNTISGKEFYIDETHPWSPSGEKKDLMTWWELRPTFVMVPYPSWVELKAFIIKICKQSGKCSGAVANWERTVEGMDTHLDQKLP